jgi:hypothetical protein
MAQFNKTVIPRRRRRDLGPGEQKEFGRDPWFDRLTTLSEVEGESRKLGGNQIALDPPPPLAGDHELQASHSFQPINPGSAYRHL